MMNSSALRLASACGLRTGMSNTTSATLALWPGIALKATGLAHWSIVTPAGSAAASSPLPAHRCRPQAA